MALRPKDPGGAIAALLAVQVLFGLFPVAVKMVPTLAPTTVLAVRVAGAAFCLMALLPLLSRNPIPVGREFPRLALMAVLGVALNMGLFLWGLSMTEPVEAVLVITTIPVFTYAIAVALRRERLGPRRAAGIGLAMLGVGVLLVGTYHAEAPDRLLGDLLILANCLSFAAFLVLGKPLMDRYDPLSVTAWMFAFGAVLVVPFGLWRGAVGQVAALDAAGSGWLVFIVLGPSVLTYLLNARALRHVHASTVAAFTYVQPVFTAIAAALLLPDRPIEWLRLLPAAALVFAGLWLVSRKDPPALEGDVAME